VVGGGGGGGGGGLVPALFSRLRGLGPVRFGGSPVSAPPAPPPPPSTPKCEPFFLKGGSEKGIFWQKKKRKKKKTTKEDRQTIETKRGQRQGAVVREKKVLSMFFRGNTKT